jgi:hypothetical protein
MRAQERVDLGRHRMKKLRKELSERLLKAPAFNRLFVQAASEFLTSDDWRELVKEATYNPLEAVAHEQNP